jgi:hypothetical protein
MNWSKHQLQRAMVKAQDGLHVLFLLCMGAMNWLRQQLRRAMVKAQDGLHVLFLLCMGAMNWLRQQLRSVQDSLLILFLLRSSLVCIFMFLTLLSLAAIKYGRLYIILSRCSWFLIPADLILTGCLYLRLKRSTGNPLWRIIFLAMAMSLFFSLCATAVASYCVYTYFPLSDDYFLIIVKIFILCMSLTAIIFSLFLIFGGVFMKFQLEQKIAESIRLGSAFPETHRISWEFGHMLALEIGLAFFVAGFITVMYELLLRGYAEQMAESNYSGHMDAMATSQNEHLRQVESSVFKATLGHNTDQPVFSEIYRTIRSSDFIRKSFVIDISLEPLAQDDLKALNIESKNNFINIIINISYELFNNNRNSMSYPYEWVPYFDSPIHLGRKHNKFTKFSIRGCQKSDGYLVSDDDNYGEGAQPYSDLKTEIVDGGMRHRLKLESEKIFVSPGNDPTTIEYTYRILTRIEDSQTWISPCPADNLRILIKDNTGTKLKFYLQSTSMREASLDDLLEIQKEWNSNTAILPHQGVTLYWHPHQ